MIQLLRHLEEHRISKGCDSHHRIEFQSNISQTNLLRWPTVVFLNNHLLSLVIARCLNNCILMYYSQTTRIKNINEDFTFYRKINSINILLYTKML